MSLPVPQLGFKMQQTNIKTRLGQEMLPDLLALVTLSDTPSPFLDLLSKAYILTKAKDYSFDWGVL